MSTSAVRSAAVRTDGWRRCYPSNSTGSPKPSVSSILENVQAKLTASIESDEDSWENLTGEVMQ
jgi:hypothetical protein